MRHTKMEEEQPYEIDEEELLRAEYLDWVDYFLSLGYTEEEAYDYASIVMVDGGRL